jgi:iron(III) transport system substrate-binding protein
MQAQITAMRDRLGDDVVGEWLDAMVENETQVYPDNISVRDAVANGEIEVGLLNHYYVAEAIALEGDGYPVAIGYLAQDDPGSLVNVAGAGRVAGTSKPEEATQFLDYLLSDEAQSYFADETKEYPLVKGVDADPALLPLKRVEQPDLDLSQLDDLRGTLDLMREHGVL